MKEEKKLMTMNLIIKNKLFFLACFVCCFFVSCNFLSPSKVDKSSIVLLTQDQMMEKISNAYEGDFTCLNYEANEERKTVFATVQCVLNGRTFSFEVVENHLVDNYFYSYYSSEGVYTKYYAERYEEEVKQVVEAILDEEFLEVVDKIAYDYNGVYVRNNINDRFTSADAYINSLKSNENIRVGYNLLVPFKKDENKEFELLLKAYDVKWVYVNAVYNQSL